MGNAEYMGTSVRSSPSIVVRELRGNPPNTKWLSLDLRRRRLMPSTSPLTTMTSRETARLMPSMLATLSVPDVFLMYKACKDSKDQGGFHDFVVILKLYDKNADDTILEHELFKLLVNLGEKLTKEEAKS